MFRCLTVFCIPKLELEKVENYRFLTLLLYRSLIAELKFLDLEQGSSSSRNVYACFVVSELFDRLLTSFRSGVAFDSSFLCSVFMNSSSRFSVFSVCALNFSNLVSLSFHYLSTPRLSVLDSPNCSRFFTNVVRFLYSFRGSG